MDGNSALLFGAAAAASGVAVLRLSWSRPKRSPGMNFAGWILLLLAGAVAWNVAGAWGVSVEALVAMTMAFVFLALAAWTSPASSTKASNRRAGMLPEAGAPLHLGRRIVTFVIVTALALFASLGLALGIRLLVILGGAGEAGANVTAIFATPLTWAVLAYALLMTSDRRRQFAMLTIASLAAVPAFLQGAYP